MKDKELIRLNWESTYYLLFYNLVSFLKDYDFSRKLILKYRGKDTWSDRTYKNILGIPYFTHL